MTGLGASSRGFGGWGGLGFESFGELWLAGWLGVDWDGALKGWNGVFYIG